MTTRNVGDQVDTRYVVEPNGVLTDATTVLTVTDPAGNVSTPTPTHTSLGVYDASFTLTTAGTWFWYWTASGTVIDVTAPESVLAASPAPPTYASLAELKSYLGVTDTSQDSQLLDSLITASRGIEHICGRKFYPDQTATSRVFRPRDSYTVLVDDFWTTTDLVVKTDSGSGTYPTTLTAGQYQLEPLNGVNDGEAGWPYNRLCAVNGTWPRNWTAIPSVQVTARWGWATVPGPVKQAAIYLAEETYKLKGSPFGVANFDQFGPIRMRDNPKVLGMLAPYRRYPVLVA